LLIVEDADDLRDLFARVFRQEGYEVTAAATGAEALALSRRAPPHAILLDLGLPDVDGMNVLTELRRANGALIVVVTGQTSPAMAAKALDSGAADYVRKPVDLGELAARVRAALRGAQPVQAHGKLAVGPLRIDPDEGEAEYGGHNLGASITEVRLLRFLASRPGTVFTKDELVRALWAGERTDHLIEVHISNLRRKLRSAGCDCELIKTVPGRGYRFGYLGPTAARPRPA
jgi:DNA-binding response OmpR family regulator